ncbi:MAG: DNRLRE domain-containing protein, partial [bacterium]
SPVSGPVGVEVTLSGSNFTGATSVSFNGTAASSFTVVSDTQLRATVAASTTSGLISVTNLDGTGQSSSSFTVEQTPAVVSFTPASGPAGTEVTVTGSDFTGTTAVFFNAAPALVFTVDTDSQIRATVPGGASTGAIVVTNSAGSGTSVSDFTVTAPPSTFTFNPTDDSFVRSSKAFKNYGSSLELRVRDTSSADVNAYLKFNVSGLIGSVQNAVIRLVVFDASSDGGGIYSVSNNYDSTTDPWQEGGIKWNNAPVISGSALSSVNAVSIGDTIEFDVTAAISGDGIYSFAIANNSSDICKYYSKEGVSSPELIVQIGSAAPGAQTLESDILTEHEFGSEQIQELDETAPENIGLRPNYPNPFNLETTIEYTLPKEARVQLFIYNLRGQEVRKLFDGLQPAGIRKTRWNGKNNFDHEVGSGVYFVRLKIAGTVLTRKITLQK